MVKRELLIATLVGVIIFITDLALGWLSFLTGPIPVLFIMVLIIGIIAGKPGDAVKATFLTWLFGILLGCLLAPIIFVDFWSDEVFLPLLPLIIMMWSTRGMFIDFQFEGTWIEAMAVAAGMFILWLVITPMLYLMSFIAAAIGGFIGKRVHERFGLTQTESSPPSAETFGIQ
jgi:hypothetical protein